LHDVDADVGSNVKAQRTWFDAWAQKVCDWNIIVLGESMPLMGINAVGDSVNGPMDSPSVA